MKNVLQLFILLLITLISFHSFTHIPLLNNSVEQSVYASQSVADVISVNSDAVVNPDELGTIDNPIIDSNMKWNDAFLGREKEIPKDILVNLTIVDLKYYSVDGKVHKGQIVIDKRLVDDVLKVFDVAFKEKFPIKSAVPVSYKRFVWDDKKSMEANNSSAFNYRKSTSGGGLSKHAYGFAIDLNPYFNPYFKEDKILPSGAKYIETRKGTLTQNSGIVKIFKRLGWEWGGDWKSLKDYQHFEKTP